MKESGLIAVEGGGFRLRTEDDESSEESSDEDSDEDGDSDASGSNSDGNDEEEFPFHMRLSPNPTCRVHFSHASNILTLTMSTSQRMLLKCLLRATGKATYETSNQAQVDGESFLPKLDCMTLARDPKQCLFRNIVLL